MDSNIVRVEPIDVSSIRSFVVISNQQLQKANAVSIQSQEELNDAGALRKEIRSDLTSLEDRRKSVTRLIDDQKKIIMGIANVPGDKLTKALAIVSEKITTYENEQEKIRAEQQEKLRRQAEAEEEKKRKELEKRIARAEASGKTNKAEELKEQQENIHVEVPIVEEIEKVSGSFKKTLWRAKVVNFKLLADEWKIQNQSALDKHAQNTKGLIPITGVEFYKL